MILDGKKMAELVRSSLKNEVERFGSKLRLAVIQVGNDPVALKFLEQKKKFGNAVGIDVKVYNAESIISTSKLRAKVSEIVHIKENTGVIVQLPLPKNINTQYILDAITSEKDPDMLSSKSIGVLTSQRNKILPPVIAAIDHIFKENGIEPKGKKAVVLGVGRLVGKPATLWLINSGATVTAIDESEDDPTLYTVNADILISGIGTPHLIKADMVKDGVVAIDCGTSESHGKLAGDMDPSVADKASLFTPVPGGVGSLTVAMLFKNLLELAKQK